MSNLMNYVKLNRACQKETEEEEGEGKKKGPFQINRRANHLSRRNFSVHIH